MTSPACQVKDGDGSYQSTVNGVDVTPANTVTINLVSSAGVSTWSIQCITTDELSDAATVNAGLTVDHVAKTATFTAPAAGRAYRFQSKVNGGIGPDGTARQDYTTTFGVYTLTAEGRRVLAVDETFESNATFGWAGSINSVIRQPQVSIAPGAADEVLTTNAAADDTTWRKLVDANIANNAGVAGTKVVPDFGAQNILTTGNVTIGSASPLRLLSSPRQLEVQPVATNSVTGEALTICGQNCTGTGTTGGNLVLAVGTGTSANGTLHLNAGGNSALRFAVNPSGASTISVQPAVTSFAIQHNATSSSNGGSLTIQAQNSTAGSSTGGTLNLTSGSGTSNPGVLNLQSGGTNVLRLVSATQIDLLNTLTRQTTATYGIANEYVAEASTTDDTTADLFTWTIQDGAVTTVDIRVSAVQSNGSAGDAWVGTITFRRASGTVTVIGEGDVTPRGATAWTVALDNSTSTGRVRITGASATTIRWFGQISMAIAKVS